MKNTDLGFPSTNTLIGDVGTPVSKLANSLLSGVSHVAERLTGLPGRQRTSTVGAAVVIAAVLRASELVNPVAVGELLHPEDFTATYDSAGYSVPRITHEGISFDPETQLIGPLQEGERMGPISTGTTLAELQDTGLTEYPALQVISDTGERVDREGFFDSLDFAGKVGVCFGAASILGFFFWAKLTPAYNNSVKYDPLKDETLQRRLARERRREEFGRLPRVRKALRAVWPKIES